ncbi:MAG: hypothetical protein ACRDNJ_04725, partial [Solirubrobacteraceae bacterium]
TARLQDGGDDVETVILHPFLMLDPAWAEGVRGLLALLATLRRGGQAWVGPGGGVAAGMTEAGG